MYFSTIGYTPNPFLEKYRQWFLMKLQNFWKTHISLDMPPPDFLLYPDIHGILLASIRPWTLERIQFIDVLQKEYLIYKKQGNSFAHKSEEIISGTNILLTWDFYNPDITNDTHPDHQKNHTRITFWSIDPGEWKTLFAQSFAIVQAVSPWFMNEINQIIKKIIPFDVSIGNHNSGSYSDVIGHIAMSYPIEIESPEIAVLEAILHEYNHNKLNLILQTESLILNNHRELYYSPYRPDARHIHGIYLGLHALAGAYWVIWQAHIAGILTLSDNWLEKAVLYTLKNGLSLQVLDHHARLTPLGREFLEEMRAVHMECLECIRQADIAREMMDRAKSALISHYQKAKQRNPGILT